MNFKIELHENSAALVIGGGRDDYKACVIAAHRACAALLEAASPSSAWPYIDSSYRTSGFETFAAVVIEYAEAGRGVSWTQARKQQESVATAALKKAILAVSK